MPRSVPTLNVIEAGDRFDVVVLGAGAAGLSAAVFAALEGCSVLLVERTEYLGGTSALSAATTWIPNTHHSDAIGAEDSVDNVLGFLDRAVGNRSPRALRETFVRCGPQVVRELEDKTDVQLRPRPFHPDYLHELQGSTACGRALEPRPFDAHSMGSDLHLIRPPIPEFTILGGMMIDRDDIAHLLARFKSLRSLGYSMKLIGNHCLQKMRYGRGTRLVMGNALVARFLVSARRLGVQIQTQTQVTGIRPMGDGSYALDMQCEGETVSITARCGVILASGGFSRHPERRHDMLPAPVAPYSPAAPGHTGELHDLVLSMGAHYGETNAQPCYWAPVSVRQRADGTQAVFPHFVLDRSKPGIMAVGRDGRRFVNESRSYHEFVAAMYEANVACSARDEGNATGRSKDQGMTIPAYLICDARAMGKYGLGMVRPGTKDLAPYLQDGYLISGQSLDELAVALDIDAAGLRDSVERMNDYARTGVDDAFSRGSTVYERANGDADHGPNPTLGPLQEAPFYALKLWPGDIGSATGLVTDDHARVLRRDGTPIPGLYACGADMNSIMGGVYPGPGITIGPAIVFGSIAAKSAAKRSSIEPVGRQEPVVS